MRRPGRIVDFLAIAGAAIVALAQSWNRWCDPIIDVGRDLYIPEQLLHGARLYREIKYFYPPLAPYLLALITSVTGHSLAAHAAIGIAQSVAVVVVLYATADRLAGRAAAFGAAFSFVCINMCGASTWGANWIFPYSYPATFGMLFFLLFVSAAVFDRRAVANAFALAACWCKIDFIFAVAVGVAALLVVRKFRVRDAVMLAASAAVTLFAAIGYFGVHALKENILPASLLHSERAARFYSLVSGAAFWREDLLDALAGACVIAAIAVLLHRNHRRLAGGLAVVAGVAMPVASFFRATGYAQWLTLLRPRSKILFLLGAFSIAATIRIAFNVAPLWYGFVLIVPLYLLIAYASRGDGIWAALLVVLSLRTLLVDQRDAYALKRYPITTSRGVVYDWNRDRAAVLNELLPRLQGSAAVFPEGLTLNYFAGVPTPLTYQTFTPVETADPAVERDIIRELTERRPQQIVVVTRDVKEFGSRGFGVDYDRALWSWLRGHYAVEQSWSRPHFNAVLLRRAVL